MESISAEQLKEEAAVYSDHTADDDYNIARELKKIRKRYKKQ